MRTLGLNHSLAICCTVVGLLLAGPSACSDAGDSSGLGGAGGGFTVGEGIVSTGVGTSNGQVVTRTDCQVRTMAVGLKNPGRIVFAPDPSSGSGTAYVAQLDASSGKADQTFGNILQIPLDGGQSKIADHLGTIRELVLSTKGDTLYWVVDEALGDTNVWSLPTSGGQPVAVHSVPVTGGATKNVPVGIAIDASHLYVGSLGGIERMSLDGSDVTSMILLDAFSSARSLVVDETNLYWIEDHPNLPPRVMWMPLAGGKPNTLLEQARLSQLAVLGALVYALDPGDQNNVPSIIQLDPTGHVKSTQIFSMEPSTQAIATDSSGLYWVGGQMTPYGLGGNANTAASSAVPVVRLSAAALASSPQLQGQGLIGSAAISQGLVSCAGGLCWVDQLTGTLYRFVECG